MKVRINTQKSIKEKYGNAKVFCNDCEKEIFVSTVNIKEAAINIKGQDLILVYFTCPYCDKIYRVTLKDKRYEELLKDLESHKARMRKNSGGGNEEFASMLVSMARKKHERLSNYVTNLNKKFSGTFTFVASENNHEEKIIKYLP